MHSKAKTKALRELYHNLEHIHQLVNEYPELRNEITVEELNECVARTNQIINTFTEVGKRINPETSKNEMKPPTHNGETKKTKEMTNNDEIRKTLEQIHTDIGYASRNMDRIRAQCDNEIFLHRGKIEAVTIHLNRASYYLREKIKPLQSDANDKRN